MLARSRGAHRFFSLGSKYITGITTWEDGTTQEVQGSVTKGCRPADTVWLDDVPYHLPEEVTQEFIDDLAAVKPVDYLIDKWGLKAVEDGS